MLGVLFYKQLAFKNLNSYNLSVPFLFNHIDSLWAINSALTVNSKVFEFGELEVKEK